MSQLITLMCKNCGAALRIEDGSNICSCPFCKTNYAVPELTIDPVNQALRAGDVFMNMGDYEKAYKKYNEVCDLAPSKYLGWWGKIRAITRDFSAYVGSFSLLNELTEYYRYVAAYVPATDQARVQEQYLTYFNGAKAYLDRQFAETQNAIQSMTQTVNEKSAEYNELASKRHDRGDGYDVWGILKLCAAIIAVGFVITLVTNKSIGFILSLILAAVVAVICILSDMSTRKMGERMNELSAEIAKLNQEIQALQARLISMQ